MSKNVPITNEEISSFSIKLQEWAKDLAPKEQALLEVLVKTASESMPEGEEIPDSELDKVAGGTGFSLHSRTLNVLRQIHRPGMEVMDLEHDMCGSMPGGQARLYPSRS